MEHVGDIFVIDDDPAILSFIDEILSDEGYQVRTAQDGPRALSALYHQPADLILLDLYLPGMNGHAILEHIRSTPGLAHIPVVVMSASMLNDEARAMIGATAVLTKPFDLGDLLDCVAYYTANPPYS